MRFLLASISCCFFFILTVKADSATENRVVICGTGDSQKLLRDLATEFSSNFPDISVEVPDSIGSSGGVKSTAIGKCDLGRVARPLKKRELKYKLTYRLFAHSPVVFFTHANVTGVMQLSAKQVVAIFSGTLTNWKDLGGTEGPIYVAHREKGDSSHRVISQLLPAFADIQKQAGETLYSTQEIVETVSAHPNTIGYTALSAIKNKDTLNTLGFMGVTPNSNNKSVDDYQLLSPFGLVWRSNPSPATEKFLHFLSTATAHAIIEDYGAIPPVADVAE